MLRSLLIVSFCLCLRCFGHIHTFGAVAVTWRHLICVRRSFGGVFATAPISISLNVVAMTSRRCSVSGPPVSLFCSHCFVVRFSVEGGVSARRHCQYLAPACAVAWSAGTARVTILRALLQFQVSTCILGGPGKHI